MIEEVPKDRGYTGLVNLGRTDYMNSVVQCLYHTKPFREHLLSETFKNELRHPLNPLFNKLHAQCKKIIKEVPEPELGNRAFQLFLVISTMWSSKFSSLKLRALKDSFTNSPQHIEESWKNDDSVHCPALFFQLLMNCIDEDLLLKNCPLLPNTLKGKKLANKKLREECINIWKDCQKTWNQETGGSFVRRLFYHQICEKHVCRKCLNNNEKIWDKEVPKDISINLILKATKNSETLVELMDEWQHIPKEHYCKCNKQMKGLNFFVNIPNILVIHLVRSEKNQKILVPKVLNLEKYIHIDVKKKRADYQLYALIHQQRLKDQDNFHYCAFLRYNIDEINEHWRRCDDRRVEPFYKEKGEEEAITSEKAMKYAYLLFYEKKKKTNNQLSQPLS